MRSIFTTTLAAIALSTKAVTVSHELDVQDLEAQEKSFLAEIKQQVGEMHHDDDGSALAQAEAGSRYSVFLAKYNAGLALYNKERKECYENSSADQKALVNSVYTAWVAANKAI